MSAFVFDEAAQQRQRDLMYETTIPFVEQCCSMSREERLGFTAFLSRIPECFAEDNHADASEDVQSILVTVLVISKLAILDHLEKWRGQPDTAWSGVMTDLVEKSIQIDETDPFQTYDADSAQIPDDLGAWTEALVVNT